MPWTTQRTYPDRDAAVILARHLRRQQRQQAKLAAQRGRPVSPEMQYRVSKLEGEVYAVQMRRKQQG